MPVSTEQMAGYPVYQATRDSISATQQVKIAWGDINAYLLELFPPSVGGAASLPALLPGSTNLYADSVDFQPFLGQDDRPSCVSGMQSYTHALATVQYKNIPYEQGEDENAQIITRRWDISGDIMTMPTAALKWVTDDKPLPPDIVAGKIIPMIDFTVTLHRVSQSYFNTLKAKILEFEGTVNNDTWEGARIGSLLLLGGNFTENISSDGSRTYTVDIKFQYKSVKVEEAGGDAFYGWNYFFNPKTGKWGLVSTKDDELPVYSYSDFSELYA